MWTCKNCNEESDDVFDECWKCSAIEEVDELADEYKDNVVESTYMDDSISITKKILSQKTLEAKNSVFLMFELTKPYSTMALVKHKLKKNHPQVFSEMKPGIKLIQQQHKKEAQEHNVLVLLKILLVFGGILFFFGFLLPYLINISL